jgi:hypothetical protein
MDVFGGLIDKISIAAELPYYPYYPLIMATSIAGNLTYNWKDNYGKIHNQTSQFKELIRLGRINLPKCGPAIVAREGATVESIAQGPLDLNLDQTNKRIALPLRRSISAGRVARFELPFVSDKSSEHNFAVVLQLSDGRAIRSRPIKLLYYYPSWFVDSRKF